MNKIYAIILTIFTSLYFFTGLLIAQEVSAPTLTYVMTYQADLRAPQVVAPNRLIWEATSGWVKTGDGTTGKIIAPSADWMTVRGPDSFSLDVRASILMDDGAQIFVEYKGRIKLTEEGLAKMQAGELLTENDFYFIIAPNVMTIAEKYLWMNDAIFVGKTIAFQPPTQDKLGYVKYDVYVVNM